MAESNRTWMRFQWRTHKLLWNLSGGRLGRRVAGMPVLELVTIGHKSGQERQILISYVGDDDAPLVVGSNAGRDVDPAWVKNLRVNPRARMRLGVRSTSPGVRGEHAGSDYRNREAGGCSGGPERSSRG